MSKYRLSFKNTAALQKYIEEQGVQFINCNFTDLNGKWHHLARYANSSVPDLLNNGVIIENSSVITGGFDNGISELLIKPDISRVSYDPFAAQKTIKILCDIYDPNTGLPYALDPRSTARKAHNYLKKSKVGDIAYFGSEIEFFVFNDVKVVNTANQVGYHLDGEEGYYNKGRDYPTGNMGHRPSANEAFLTESPVDSLSDIRAEMLSVIESMGVEIEKHYHGVAASQCGLGLRFAELLEAADNIQFSKHAVRNVAHGYGKSATFMPKPINAEYGSALHINQTLLKNGSSIFSGDQYANLSETALHYLGGVLKHADALSAFANPATNSYKRLAGEVQSPVMLTYSKQNAMAACHIPYTKKASAKCVEACFPDPTANPYLLLSALLMAGLDGIENKIDPGEAFENRDKESYPEKMCGSLREALDALRADNDFLLKEDVFTAELIEAYIALKMREVKRFESVTHPVEVDMYYSS